MGGGQREAVASSARCGSKGERKGIMPARPAAKVKRKAVQRKAVRKQVKSVPAKSAVKPKAAKLAAKVTKTTPAKPAPPAKPAAKRTKETPETKELKKFREVLLAERARLQAELEEIEERTSRATLAERATELSSYEDHPADLASETFEREKDIAIAESVESLLNQVNTALEKVERGTYGICDACGRPIKKLRLQALPFATLCLECQGRLES